MQWPALVQVAHSCGAVADSHRFPEHLADFLRLLNVNSCRTSSTAGIALHLHQALHEPEKLAVLVAPALVL